MSRIASIRATPANVPMTHPYRFAFGTLAAFTTTVVEVTDTDGVTGLGEAPHGDLTAAVDRLAERLVGLPVDAVNEHEARAVGRQGFSLWGDAAAARRAHGAVELALWDLRGRREGRPLVELLGGAVRERIGFTEYFALRRGCDETPAEVIRTCAALLQDDDVPWFEGKLGVLAPGEELAMVTELVRVLGSGRVLRLDANGAYTVPVARQVVHRLADLGVGWVEDPCRTLDETARLRADGVPVSFSTHEPDLVRAARTGVPDGFCCDIAELGGLRRTQDFLRACDALGTAFWCYSGDAGIMTAAYLHLSAAEPSMIHPHQSLFRWTADVAVEQGPFRPRQGHLTVPDGPGLGVTLDRAALSRMHDHYRTHGPMPTGRAHEAYGEGFTRW